MSYEQQNWVTGNRITAEKLNHMEEGIASGSTEPLVIHFTGETTTEQSPFGPMTFYLTDTKFSDAKGALDSGRIVFVQGFAEDPSDTTLNMVVSIRADGLDVFDRWSAYRVLAIGSDGFLIGDVPQSDD